MKMPDPVIKIDGLTITFGKKAAVQNLDLEIPRGSICGLVGPNGAGKTTTIKTLIGLLSPSSGNVKVFGLDPLQETVEIRQRIGYVPEKHFIYEWMKVKQVLKFTSEIYRNWDWEECNRITEFLALPEKLEVKKLSRGELAKLALTIALSHNPELLILDEPTSGLDPLIRREFLESIIRIIENGDRSVFFSTHILSDIERVADRVIILDQGKKIADDQLETLRSQYIKASFVFNSPPNKDTVIPDSLRTEKGIREWVAIFCGPDEDRIQAISEQVGASDWMVMAMTFEEVFIELLSKNQAKEEPC